MQQLAIMLILSTLVQTKNELFEINSFPFACVWFSLIIKWRVLKEKNLLNSLQIKHYNFAFSESNEPYFPKVNNKI